MRTRNAWISCCIAGTFALVVTPVAHAQTADAPTYKPPSRGAPAARVGGGTRGAAVVKRASVAVLAPNHTGSTVSAQPTLYWYLSEQAPVRIELTLVDDASVKPLIERVLATSPQPGIHAISLKDLGVTLKPGVEYRWHVALVNDAKQRSGDVTSSGTVRLVPEPESLKTQLSQAGGAKAYAAYAEQGLWYDAIDTLMRLINASPGDKQLRDHLDALLSQVGLTRVAHLH